MINTVRTPYHQMPITMVMKATYQKAYRQMHCIECGWPLADITSKVVVLFDGETPIARMEPDSIGIVEIHCNRHTCKQYYRLEFAV